MIEASIWVLRIEPVSSGRAALTLKLGDISTGPEFFLMEKLRLLL